MRWHVMVGAKTFGPLEAELVGEMLRDGKLGSGVFVKDEAGGAWMPVEKSPFHSLVRKQSSLIDVALKIVLVLAIGFALLAIPWMCQFRL